MSNELDNPLLTPVNPGDVQVLPSGGPVPLPSLPGGSGADMWNSYAGVLSPPQGIDPNAPTETVPTVDANAFPVSPNGVPPVPVEAPLMVDKKVGQQTDSTTTQDQSQATRDALAQKDQASASEKDAIKKKAESDIAVSKKEAERDKMESGLLESVYSAKATATQELIQKVNDDIAKRDAMAAELTNQKPETFWGSKSAADKISAALSVGLGAYGQALLGSGQNVGMVLLQRNMDEYQTIQKQRYDAKVKQIEAMNTSIDNKANMIGKLDHMYDAQVLAGKEKVRGMYAQVLQEAKTPGVQAAAQKAAGEIDAQAAQFKAETAAKYEAKHTSSLEQDVIKKVQQEAGMGPDGKPISESQAKARVALSSILEANKTLSAHDLGTMNESPVFQRYLKDKGAREGVENFPFLGKFLGSAGDNVIGSPEEKLAQRDAETARAVSAMNAWTQSLTRFNTGAALKDSEVQMERDKYFPVRGDTADIIRDKARTRAALEKAMRDAAGLGR